ncbi:hornerin isoform X1 [Anastrepha ludens]|uniref:hornerin isoform X1 n=1 Tax=Anastrepha ludens TaxID=28586 RepID=UPI0023AFD7F6|nr:hornerin isoform X1 [Anastrepha ludens]
MNCLCRPSRIMSVRINLLDETDFIHEIKDDLPGQALLDVVFARLNLIETSYFGIRYIDEENQTHWLDPASRISRQLKPKSDPYDLYFGVKFYAADPCKLLEEITRYQLFLQVKQDVLQGRLPVAFELAAELGAFVVQSELGDYDQRRHSKGYVSEFRLLPNQSSELETRVAELHQQLKGMSPATAELNYLDKVKWHDMYGVDLHPVLGEDSVEYFLGLTPSGIVVLRNKTTVAHYYWPRIAKVYYKGRYFMLRISDKNNELSTYGFETPRKSACKHLWRCCVEHHAFFRMVRIAPLPNSQSNNSDLFQLGSRLRYSNRSEKQPSSKDALGLGRIPPAFTRVPSKRQPRRLIDDFLSGSKSANNTQNGIGIGHNSSSVTDGGGCGNHNGVGVGAGMQTANLMPNNYESPYRSTYSIPTSLGIRPYHQQSHFGNNGGGSDCNSNLQTPDSPRSTRSAPWPRSQQRSLFGNNPSSPRSVRSAIATSGGGGGGGSHHHHQHQHHHHHHQSSGTSTQHRQSSHSAHRDRDRDHVSSSSASAHQQRYRSSSVESHSSNDSRSTRRHKHRHRRTSDNESELSRGSGRSGRSHHRKHRRSRHRRDSAGSDHESARGRSYSGHRSSSVRSGSAELIDSTSQWREVQRRQAEASLGQSSVQQASVSKSSMVARSLHSNDSHSDTHSHHKSRRHRKNKSPSDSRNRIWSSELAKHLQFDLVDTTGMTEDQLREIPYTVVETNSKRSTMNMKIHKSGSKGSVGGKSTGSGNTITNGSSSTGGQGKNRVDRIRGLYFQNSNVTDNVSGRNGSIRSASTISSRECERNSGLVRMMSSMSMGDFISPTGSNLSPLENSALRVSHEHTDSGLGADQDYAYSSERSSDSTRYGTNKSSGASSGSHRKSIGGGGGGGGGGGSGGGGGGTSTYNILMQQTVSNQQMQHQQQQQQAPPRQTSCFAQRQQQPSQSKPIYNNPNSHTSHAYQMGKLLAPIHTSSNTHGPSSLASSHHSATNLTNTNEKCISKAAIPNSNSNANSNNNSNTNNKSNNSNSSSGVGNRLLNYTTFENNQYKFSLNNVFGKATGAAAATGHNVSSGNGSSGNITGGGAGSSNAYGCGSNLSSSTNRMDSFVEWPNTPAAPYYYQGPPSVAGLHIKKRDAKSDIGVPTRRYSGQAITKTQLLTGQLPGASYYHTPAPIHTAGMGSFDSRLHPAKSDLFLSYIHHGTGGSTALGAEYERPYIYNYKMPQMPDFLRGTGQQQQQQQNAPSEGHQQMSAYHISGAQTADPPPPQPTLYKPTYGGGGGGGGESSGSGVGVESAMLYGGAAPATDVLYYQFDNGKPPIVQQPKSLLHKAANNTGTGGGGGGGTGAVVGPLVFLQHASVASSSTSAQQPQTCTNTNQSNTTTTTTSTTQSSTCSEGSIEEYNEEELEDVQEVEEEEDEARQAHDDACTEQANACNNDGLILNNEVLAISPAGSGNNNYGCGNEALESTDCDCDCDSLTANCNLDNCNANNNADSGNANINANVNAANVHTNTNNSLQTNNPRTTSNNTPPSNRSIPNANSTLNRNRSNNSQPNLNSNQNPNQYQYQNTNLISNSSQNLIAQNHNQISMQNSNTNVSTLQNQMNPNISSSLEIILSPIIQSSRRAQ